MSSTAKGSVGCPDGKNVQASFVIDGVHYNFTGSYDPPTAFWESPDATLTYNTVADLTSTRRFLGFLGTPEFSMDLGEGVRFFGNLVQPHPQNQIAGSGTWATNEAD